MDLFQAIDTRASAARLSEPGPTAEQLRRLLASGVRAPDHGRLAPWRYLLLEGPDRALLANAYAASLARRAPGTPPEELERAGAKAFRAPTIIVAAAELQRGHKVPEIEQMMAVAAAVQNIFLSAHAMGLGMMWKSGAPAYDPGLVADLGLPPDCAIVGFLYLGTPVAYGQPRDLEPAAFARVPARP